MLGETLTFGRHRGKRRRSLELALRSRASCHGDLEIAVQEAGVVVVDADG